MLIMEPLRPVPPFIDRRSPPPSSFSPKPAVALLLRRQQRLPPHSASLPSRLRPILALRQSPGYRACPISPVAAGPLVVERSCHRRPSSLFSSPVFPLPTPPLLTVCPGVASSDLCRRPPGLRRPPAGREASPARPTDQPPTPPEPPPCPRPSLERAAP
ncbi:hypothetical protein NL676_000201 [Syzygium grande]|nr:hypothetical protein NL676_000201 [Syzygium grande]